MSECVRIHWCVCVVVWEIVQIRCAWGWVRVCMCYLAYMCVSVCVYVRERECVN
jgi:hypothetical protein